MTLLDSCWTREERESALRDLIEDCRSQVFQERHESRKLLFAYAFGKPTEHIQHEILNPQEVAAETLEDLREKYPELSDQQLQVIIDRTFGDVTEHGQIG
jgi:hypothetical protein